MSPRHIARTLALQTLFELDLKGALNNSNKEEIEKIILRDQEEFGDGLKDTSFAKNLVETIVARRITIDDIIVRAAPDWPLDKIGNVDRNILRIGLSELLFGDRKDVPPKVAIDESIELAKTFGGETSSKFINGVLGAIYKEMGEPEKDQTTQTSKGINSREKLVGAVVYAYDGDELKTALVHDVFGNWTLSKGKVEEEGDIKEIAKKKIKTEIGVDVEILNVLGENEYIANKPEQGKVIKHVTYFLAKSEFTPLVLEKKGGLDDAKWLSFEDTKGLKIYNDIKDMLKKAQIEIEKK